MSLVAEGDLTRTLHVRVESLFVAHVDAAFNVAYRVLWNRADAEDVVQTAFVKAFSRFDQLDDKQRARPWLLQIAYRESITVLRRRRDVPVDPSQLPDGAAVEPGPAELAVMSDIAAEISRALECLGSGERMAVVLRDVEQLSMREVAEVLGIGVSAAKMRVHRGRQSLRLLLERTEVHDAV